MHFTKNEYLSRMKKTQLSMVEKGIDLLLVTDPANMCYLSGHDAWSFYVHQGIIVTLTDEMPIFVGRYMDAFSGVVKTTYLDEAHVRAYSDTFVHNPSHHPMERFAEVIEELGCANKVIGLEMDNYWFTAAAYESLKKNLPNATFKDANLLVNWVRIIKSDQEIEYQKRAGKLAELAIQAAVDTIAPGVRQCDVVAAIYSAQIRGTSEFGGDYPSIVPMLPAGETAGAPHLTWNDEKYPENVVISVEIAGCYHRYHSPLARTVCVGNPNPKVDDVAKIAVEGLEAALAIVKPGIYLEEMESTFRKVLAKHGLEKEARIGYSTGLNYPPDWGEHTASIRSGDKTILQPNMTFHCIPGMYFDNFGVSISEAFRVTETGHETFANYSRELIYR
ncbi:MAG: M24 family metallopeptidase [Peptostreptococcaceae bacterium]|nr:M24 family metallopeptidase [Peptostreptococcaceae bacterium]